MRNVIILVCVVGIVAVFAAVAEMGCGGQGEPNAGQPAPTSPGQQTTAPKSASGTGSAAGPAGPAITAENIVGTKWQAGPFTLEFGANGALTFNGNPDGKWSISGTTLNIDAGGKTYAAQIQGDKLLYGGMELKRIS